MDDPIDTLAGDETETERKLGVFPKPPLAECPVVFLGYDGGKVFFAMPQGEIRCEQARQIAGMLKTDIFCCEAGQAFLTYWRSSDDDKFAAQLCAVWFNRQCRDAGKWDTRRVMRSLGVWPGEPGEVVLHKGDETLRYQPDGSMTAVSILDSLRATSGPLYRLFPPAPRPGEPATAADGQWVRDQFDMWRFEALGDEGLSGADVLAGWLIGALLGAVPHFRPHLLIRALQGSGKTTLMTLVHALLSSLSGDLINSFSDAGWRADIAGMARPLVVDEAEADKGDGAPGAVEQVLNYLRLMATGAGQNRKMGDVGGGVTSQTAVGSAILAAILPPPLDNALATRVAEIKLLALNESDLPPEDRTRTMATDETILAATARARDLAPRLLARALLGARRYHADVSTMKAALIEAKESPRTADLIAALAAGRRLLMTDAPLTPEEAASDVWFWRPLLERRDQTQGASNPGADLLAHILTWPTDQHSNDRKLTIGDMIAKWADNEEVNLSVLKNHGLRLYEGPGPDGRPGPWLLVANKHPGLTRITARTQWKDHRSTLEYLDQLGPDDRTWPVKPLHYGPGEKHRGLAVPLAPRLEKPSRRVPSSVPNGVPSDGHEF
jgi:hypothetical protein